MCRKAIEINSTYANAWTHLGYYLTVLSAITGADYADAEAALRTANKIDPANGGIKAVLRGLPLSSTNPDEVRWIAVRIFFRARAREGHAADALKLLDDVGMADRWRPLYKALAAIAEGSAARLRRVAPEVRKPAEEIIRDFLPDGLPGLAPHASPTK